MSEIKWGYTSQGGRRHLFLAPKLAMARTALCSTILIGEINPEKLKYWVACLHCTNKRHLLRGARCCGDDCSWADDTCHGEVLLIGEVYDEETGDCWWEHGCDKHREERL